MTEDQKTKAFKEKWGSRIKPLKEADGPKEYIAFVLQSDWELILAAIELLSKQFAGQKNDFAGTTAPNLGSLQAVYIYLDRQNPKPKQPNNCPHCLGSGYVVNIFHGPKICDPKQHIKARASTLHEYVASCSCYYGNKTISMGIRQKHVNYSFGPIGGRPNEEKTTNDKIREYIDKCHEMFIEDLQQRTEAAQAVAGG